MNEDQCECNSCSLEFVADGIEEAEERERRKTPVLHCHGLHDRAQMLVFQALLQDNGHYRKNYNLVKLVDGCQNEASSDMNIGFNLELIILEHSIGS